MAAKHYRTAAFTQTRHVAMGEKFRPFICIQGGTYVKACLKPCQDNQLALENCSQKLGWASSDEVDVCLQLSGGHPYFLHSKSMFMAQILPMLFTTNKRP